jgi:hypothetical protein
MLTLTRLDHGTTTGAARDLLASLPPLSTADLFERDEIGAPALAVSTNRDGTITLGFGWYDRNVASFDLRSFVRDPSTPSCTFATPDSAARAAVRWLAC